MSKIKQFDKANLKDIRSEVDAALAAVNEKFGIKLALGSIRFDANTFSAKLEAGLVLDSGEVIDKSVTALKAHAKWILGDDFDVTQTLTDRKLGDIKVVGLNTRKSKNPVVIQQVSTGKKFNCSVELVRLKAKLPEMF